MKRKAKTQKNNVERRWRHLYAALMQWMRTRRPFHSLDESRAFEQYLRDQRLRSKASNFVL